jgi:hypothetical protein
MVFFAHGTKMAYVGSALKSGRAANVVVMTKSSARDRSAQSIIIAPKAPKILKWLRENLGISGFHFVCWPMSDPART